MGEIGISEMLRKIRKKLGKPIKLSELEKKRVREIFEEVKNLLDGNLKKVLEMDRDEAYRYINLLIRAFERADANFHNLVVHEEKSEVDNEDLKEEIKEPVSRPDFNAILAQLKPEERRKAEDLLNCVKQFPEVGEDIVCPDCSLERIRACIRTEDPSIQVDPRELAEEVTRIAKKEGSLPERG